MAIILILDSDTTFVDKMGDFGEQRTLLEGLGNKMTAEI